MTKYWMALSSISGVGPKTIRMLTSRFGSPAEVFSAPIVEIARLPRLDLSLAGEIIRAGRRLAEFERLIELMSAAGIQVLCPDSREYPDLLKLTEDFPPILYKRGADLPDREATAAIVGTRFPTSDGVRIAEDMAERLAGRGVVIVSGLARGIDTAAHRGALKAGGRTVAVLGSGLKMVYPRENCHLADEICVNGAIVSECHPNEVVSGQRLIQRNRIISGLSLGVFLVEPSSGALNTAERALKQNRRVFMYEPGSNFVLPSSLPESVTFIHKMDVLDDLAFNPQIVEDHGSQMSLL